MSATRIDQLAAALKRGQVASSLRAKGSNPLSHLEGAQPFPRQANQMQSGVAQKQMQAQIRATPKRPRPPASSSTTMNPAQVAATNNANQVRSSMLKNQQAAAMRNRSI